MLGYAVSGRAASGKSAFASLLAGACAAHGRESRVFAFADAIKAEVLHHYGITKADPGGREKLIDHGEARRVDDEDYWINLTMPAVSEAIREGVVPIIDDLRFRRELSWCRLMGLVTVRVEAPLATRVRRLRERGADPWIAQAMIPSEVELDHVALDHRIQNDGKASWLDTSARSIVYEQLQVLHG